MKMKMRMNEVVPIIYPPNFIALSASLALCLLNYRIVSVEQVVPKHNLPPSENKSSDPQSARISEDLF